MAQPAALLRELQRHARKQFGQHFLASDGVVSRILDEAGVVGGSRVLEIGPGLGVMTEALLGRGALVTAVELDRDLAAFLRQRHAAVIESGQLRLVEGDALRQDWGALLGPGGGWRAVANLPYNVGTRITTDLLRQHGIFDGLMLMLQREVAERMVAPAGHRKRGSLSVFVEAHARARVALRVRPGAFHPPPKVDSAVVELLPHGGAIAPHTERVLRAAFRTPRKAIRNPLSSVWPRAEVDAALERAGVDPGARPATLALTDFEAIAAQLGPG